MLIREARRLIFVILPLLLFTFVSWKLYNNEPIQVPTGVSSWIDRQFDKNQPSAPASNQAQEQKETLPEESHTPPAQDESASPFAPVPGLDVLPLPLTDSDQTLEPIIPPPPSEPEEPFAAVAPPEQPAPPAEPVTPAEPVVPVQPPSVAAPDTTSPELAQHTGPLRIEDTHDIIYSVSKPDKKYFAIHMGNQDVMNPNIIPHPSLPDTWIVVAQQDGTFSTDMRYFTELYCNAQFAPNGSLTCVNDPAMLPVEPTFSDKCSGNLAFAAFNVGPHDARVFYGPEVPYTIYGSQSSYACFGLWAQDLRDLVQWGADPIEHKLFSRGTEIQRPLPWGRIEKNFFLFWDKEGNVYAHHDITPRRVFAKIEADGSAGPDLAPASYAKDEKCLIKYIPKLAPEFESIHQATNSLSITLCKRADSSCKETDDNTVLFTIYQHKKFHYLHAVYEPYVMAYKRTAPFEIYGMSKKPIWVNGRTIPDAKAWQDDPHHVTGEQMIYVVSMNWKKLGQNYHGYLDDELFLSFGIEDHNAGSIDILAGDLFKGLEKCE